MLKFDFTNPVTRLSGNEFLPKPGLTFVQQILEYFQSFDCKAQPPWGEVLLDKKGIQSDKSHGIGRIKAASFAFASLLSSITSRRNDNIFTNAS